MKKTTKKALMLIAVFLLAFTLFAGYTCFADGEETESVGVSETGVQTEDEQTEDAQEENEATFLTETGEVQETGTVTSKAIAAAACIALVAAIGAISMGFAISKAADGISRQPEADGKIRTTLMLGLVFIETVVIYALIVAILIIFVL